VHWIQSDRKNSRLFIDHLKQLLRAYPDKRVIHVILDNYRIHSSRQTQTWLAEHGQRIRLHFLPPYCPDENRAAFGENCTATLRTTIDARHWAN
jgi:transposase